VVAPIALPRLYELFVGPLSFTNRVVAGIVIAAGAGVALYLIYRSSARNEPS
jgi:uncharacterized membrane protein YraQ (UPF0718 family)